MAPRGHSARQGPEPVGRRALGWKGSPDRGSFEGLALGIIYPEGQGALGKCMTASHPPPGLENSLGEDQDGANGEGEKGPSQDRLGFLPTRSKHADTLVWVLAEVGEVESGLHNLLARRLEPPGESSPSRFFVYKMGTPSQGGCEDNIT